jgi:hypothetical protein
MLPITIIEEYLYADSSEFQILSEYIISQQTISPISRGNIIADVKGIDEGRVPDQFRLEQNYPNPFNPSTSIQYAVSSRQFVSLKVYDILGNEIATLINEEKAPGSYEVEFSAKGGSASGGNAYNLPSGVYIYSLRAGSFVQSRKMILLK